MFEAHGIAHTRFAHGDANTNGRIGGERNGERWIFDVNESKKERVVVWQRQQPPRENMRAAVGSDQRLHRHIPTEQHVDVQSIRLDDEAPW